MSIRFISDASSRSTLKELWLARHLIQQLIIRDLSVRYRRTILGWLWALLNPMLNLALYYTVFGIMIRVKTPDYSAPYSWVLLSGLILWMLFSATLNSTSEALMNNLHLIKKIYFPRSALTIAIAGTCATDFIFALICTFILLSICGMHWSMVKFPLTLVSAVFVLIAGWGIGCILAVLRLRFRDLSHIIPLLLQGGFYLTPVVWTPAILPEKFSHMLILNPLIGFIGLFRYALFDGPFPGGIEIFISASSCLFIGLAGYLFFIHYEAEVIDRE